MCPAVEVRGMQGVRLHTSILSSGGAGVLPAAVGEHAGPARVPAGVPRVGLHRAALFPAPEVTRHADPRLIIVIERCYVTFERILSTFCVNVAGRRGRSRSDF